MSVQVIPSYPLPIISNLKRKLNRLSCIMAGSTITFKVGIVGS